ncbi:MAG TPA: hypothetical protein PLQ97_14490 [Myxococcota bacterium]|nr:hypothetical protein [Myxococcota bacterium]HQK49900.1 hypothetical protein [Myxococcota bacterium]
MATLTKNQENRIRKILQSLDGYEGIVTVDFNEKGGPGTIMVKCERFQALSLKFSKGTYWFGNPIVEGDELDRAVVSLRSELEACQFVSAYKTMIDLRARRASE